MRLLLLAALTTLPLAAQELSGAQLGKLKDATVYVKHVGFHGLETGSGYLFRKDGKTGWVLTAAHVVKDTDTATVVLRSGREGEAKVEAKVVATDKDGDLACLRFAADDIPAAVELSLKTEVKETEAVFAVGFPFGPSLSTAGDNPAPSVTKTTVSSVRRDEAGECVIVQLTGDINPGNSGGGVFDAKGRLVGIATSRIQGTEMCFAVPPERLRAFLRPHAGPAAFGAAEAAAGKLAVRVSSTVFDPLDKVQSTGIAWVRKDAVRETPAAGSDGKWKAVSASLKEVALKPGEAATSVGTIEIARGSADGDAVDVWAQAWWVGADGVKCWSEPVAGTARAGK